MAENREQYRFSNALGYTFEQLAEMHNLSFSGYFVPLTMTPAQVSDFWRVNQVDATRCVVMHAANGAFVGMARMGKRGARGWCGGFGIVPEFRGSGASRLLAQEMVRVARESGLVQLQLEVLTQNERARRLYERVGFVIRRRLFGLELATSALPAAAASSLSLEHVPPETLPSYLQQPAEQPYWGRELVGVLTQPYELLVANGHDGQRNAFIVQRTDDKIRVQPAQFQGELTDDEFAAILRAAAADATTILAFNEPEESPLLPYYRRLGFSEFFSQYEMTLNL